MMEIKNLLLLVKMMEIKNLLLLVEKVVVDLELMN
jgi:hypothetical protein